MGTVIVESPFVDDLCIKVSFFITHHHPPTNDENTYPLTKLNNRSPRVPENRD